jgi:hypothetical protein
MLEREQQLGYALAGVGAVATVALVAAGPGTLLSLVLGLVGSVGLAAAVRSGHRIVTALVAIAVGFVVPFVPLEILALVYSGFIMLRASKAQAKINASKPRLSPAQRAQQRRAKRDSAKSGDSDATPTVRRPTANRRYTPPKSNARRR